MDRPNREPDHRRSLMGRFSYWFDEMIAVDIDGAVHPMEDRDGVLYGRENDGEWFRFVPSIQDVYQEHLIEKMLLCKP